MLNDTIELINLTEIDRNYDLAVNRAKSGITDAQSPSVQIYFDTDDNLEELFEQTVLIRECGCELHCNEASFELFECKDHLEVSNQLNS